MFFLFTGLVLRDGKHTLFKEHIRRDQRPQLPQGWNRGSNHAM
jgi:hypothetical protein